MVSIAFIRKFGDDGWVAHDVVKACVIPGTIVLGEGRGWKKRDMMEEKDKIKNICIPRSTWKNSPTGCTEQFN